MKRHPLLLVALCGCLLTARSAASSLVCDSDSARAPVLTLCREGRYAEAMELAKHALAAAEQMLGADHPNLACLCTDLAMIHDFQGEYAEAESLYRRALLIHERTHGRTHPGSGRLLANLATMCRLQGQYQDAESLYTEALVILEDGLGPDHMSVASALNGLAILRCSQDEFTLAEELYKRELGILVRIHATGPEVGMVLQKLAVLYDSVGEDSLAGAYYARVRACMEVH